MRARVGELHVFGVDDDQPVVRELGVSGRQSAAVTSCESRPDRAGDLAVSDDGQRVGGVVDGEIASDGI
jgi:hypothetical protein